MTSRRRFHGEQGASLVLALVFLMIFSLVSVSTLGLAGAGFRTTTVTDDRSDRLYAADGGIEWGVEKLADESVCPDGDSQEGLGSFTTEINGKIVTVECIDTEVTETTIPGSGGGGGLSPIMNGYAVIARGSNGIKGNNPTNGPINLFVGDVYSRGNVSVSSGSPFEIDGRLVMWSASACPGNIVATECARERPVPDTEPPTPQVMVPTTPAPPPRMNGSSCTVLYPGRYSQAPNFNSANTYLASGTYYFFSGELNLNGTIFGGQPGPGEAQAITGVAPCATDAQAQALAGGPSVYDAGSAGSGVTIIIGGNTNFRVQGGSSAKIELFSRIPGPAEAAVATPHVSIWGRHTQDGANPQSAYTALTNSTNFYTQQKQATVVIHGATYLPESGVEIREPLNPAAPSGGLFLGGLVADNLFFNTDGNGSPTDQARVAGGGAGTPTTVTTPIRTVLQATVPGTNTIITAVIDRTTSPPTISSWRTM